MTLCCNNTIAEILNGDTMRKKIKIIIGLVALAAVLAIGWYLASPIFINRIVDEDFPINLPSMAEASEMSAEEVENTLVGAMQELEDLSDVEKTKVEKQLQELATLMPDKTIDDNMPSEEPIILKAGQFTDADSFHKGSGKATIYELPTNNRILRFEDFRSTNGPDLHVILSSNPNPTNRSNIGDDYIDLGSLKGNLGNQNYDIPADVDLSGYESVVIYCKPFHVVFSTASLLEQEFFLN